MPRRNRNQRSQQSLRHPSYTQARNDAGRTWVEKERERSGRDINRRFVYIIGFCILLLIVAVLGFYAVSTSNNTSSQTQSVTAADTYAISSETQASMEQTCRDFTTALLASIYLDDADTAQGMRDMALSYMATGTASYSGVQNMSVGGGNISQDELKVDITSLRMTNGGKAYSGIYEYKLHAQASDSQYYADRGYNVTIQLQQATDENGGNQKWVISYVRINKGDDANS